MSIKFCRLLLIVLSINNLQFSSQQQEFVYRSDADGYSHLSRRSESRKTDDKSSSLLNQQQIIQPVSKLNLADFGLDIKNVDGKKIYQTSTTSTTTTTTERTNYKKDLETSNDNESIRLRNLQNRLRESEWEFYDFSRNRNPKFDVNSRTTKSISTTSTTTSTTRRPFESTTKGSNFIKSNSDESTNFKSFKSGQSNLNCDEQCVPRHMLQHYYIRNCRSIFNKNCNCIQKFICPDYEEDINLNDNSYCKINGNRRRYLIGETIPIPNMPCSACRCVEDQSFKNDTKLKAIIDCSKVIDCPEMVFNSIPSRSDCYFSYTHDKCCGVEICRNQLKSGDIRLARCNYRNQTFRFGEKISLINNRCKICICNQFWNELDPESSTKSCIEQICLNEHFSKNCIPIYQMDRCCPVDFICPDQRINKDYYHGNDKRKHFKSGNKANSYQHNDNCILFDKEYKLNSTIKLSRVTTLYGSVCATCQCKITPYMTCIHQSCF